jgi:hypothetical protein
VKNHPAETECLSASASHPTIAFRSIGGERITARSEENIREWMSYLPQDCVEAMIRMGWDEST